MLPLSLVWKDEMPEKTSRSDYSNIVPSNNAQTTSRSAVQYDLRGVRCPMSWVKAKLCLEQLAPGTELVLWLDDPKGARDLPRAAEAEGHAVTSAEFDAQAQAWRIVIEK